MSFVSHHLHLRSLKDQDAAVTQETYLEQVFGAYCNGYGRYCEQQFMDLPLQCSKRNSAPIWEINTQRLLTHVINAVVL